MMHRRVIALASVGLVIGCSYDWTIGTHPLEAPDNLGAQSDSGVVTVRSDAGDAGPPVHSDAGDAGPPVHTATTGECGASCACGDNQSCEFTCTKGTCSLSCSGTSDCRMQCQTGAQCTIACSEKTNCQMECAAGSNCTFECRDDADCTGTCKAASLCTRKCRRRCAVDCSGGAVCR